MHDSEATIPNATARLEQTGRRFGAPVGFPWDVILDVLLSLFKDCGKDAVKVAPFRSRLRLTSALRRAMPGASVREIFAVRETIMATAIEAADADLDEFGEINL
jgi:hypothetical protein